MRAQLREGSQICNLPILLIPLTSMCTWNYSDNNAGNTQKETMEITLNNGRIAQVIAKTDRGWVARYSQGEYPWSSSVVLEGEKNGNPFQWVYPTEINPRGELEVDAAQRDLLVELQSQPMCCIKWVDVYPRKWVLKQVAECQVIAELTLSYVEGLPINLTCKYPEPGMYLGKLSQHPGVTIEESVLTLLKQEEVERSVSLREKHRKNLTDFLESDEEGNYYPMWVARSYRARKKDLAALMPVIDPALK